MSEKKVFNATINNIKLNYFETKLGIMFQRLKINSNFTSSDEDWYPTLKFGSRLQWQRKSKQPKQPAQKFCPLEFQSLCRPCLRKKNIFDLDYQHWRMAVEFKLQFVWNFEIQKNLSRKVFMKLNHRFLCNIKKKSEFNSAIFVLSRIHLLFIYTNVKKNQENNCKNHQDHTTCEKW